MPGLPHSLLFVGDRLRPTLAAPAATPPEPAAWVAAVDVAIVGGGISGLSIGWRLAERGLRVAVLERGRVGEGATLAATGMLAAAAEHEPGDPAFLALALESQRLWFDFARDLEARSGIDIDYRDEGTLVVALTREEVARLRFRHQQHLRDGLASRWLSGLEARALEPGLRPSVSAGLFCADDHQVDPRRVTVALARAFAAAGGFLFENTPVEALENAAGRVAGVRTPRGVMTAETVVLATGAWAGSDGLAPAGLDIPVRPLKGQALSLRTTPETGNLGHVVWTGEIHMAPKGDGRLIVGATMEERGFDDTITAGGIYALLEAARRALPSVEEMEVEAVWSGFRPTSVDDAPILGATPVPGLVLAAGHHRNGILLAPVTAAAIADLVTRGQINGPAAGFGLGRFIDHRKAWEEGNARDRQRAGA